LLQIREIVICIYVFFRGEAARKAAAATAEAVMQQQAVMAAMDAESKQETVTETPAVAQVHKLYFESILFLPLSREKNSITSCWI
jgi:hypothetical protein